MDSFLIWLILNWIDLNNDFNDDTGFCRKTFICNQFMEVLRKNTVCRLLVHPKTYWDYEFFRENIVKISKFWYYFSNKNNFLSPKFCTRLTFVLVETFVLSDVCTGGGNVICLCLYQKSVCQFKVPKVCTVGLYST